jgi:hypothetical protein
MSEARTTDDIPYVEWTVGARVNRIYADAWVSEQIGATTTVTSHAVETGAKISDHYLPDQLTAKASLFISGSPIRGDLDPDYVGKMTNFPFVRPQYPNKTPLLSPGGLVNAAEGAIGSALGLTSDPFPDHLGVLAFSQDPRGRLRKVWEQLLALRQSGTLVNVGFTQGRIENLAISSISLSRTKDDGDSGTIELEFQQMNFVSTQSAAAIPIPVEPRAHPQSDSFTVSAADADADKTSTAFAAWQKGRAALGLDTSPSLYPG